MDIDFTYWYIIIPYKEDNRKQAYVISSAKRVAICLLSGLLTACEPFSLIVGGGAAVGTMAAKEKGVSGTLGDSAISLAIKNKLYQKDTDTYGRVGVNVQHGEILLTGKVKTPQDSIDVESLVWQVGGVQKVMNELEVADEVTLGTAAHDAFITTQLKTTLLFNGDVRSINYSLKTVDGVVYVMGLAQSQEELDHVLEKARTTSGVKKVVCHAKVKGE